MAELKVLKNFMDLMGGMRRFSFASGLDHSRILKDLEPSGIPSYRFFFFVSNSAGIDRLGMLLHSGLVVLGGYLKGF